MAAGRSGILCCTCRRRERPVGPVTGPDHHASRLKHKPARKTPRPDKPDGALKLSGPEGPGQILLTAKDTALSRAIVIVIMAVEIDATGMILIGHRCA